MSADTVSLHLASIEGIHLAHLIDEFLDMLRDQSAGDDDPALTRLTPDVYPEDAEASSAFASATRDDLLDRRAADAALVRAALIGFEDQDPLGAEDEPVSQEVLVPDAEIDAWLRTLTALRLVLAQRLGIVVDDDLSEDDPRRGVYDWLGYRLELLIQSADALD